jgi:hypothetical protein
VLLFLLALAVMLIQSRPWFGSQDALHALRKWMARLRTRGCCIGLVSLSICKWLAGQHDQG